MFVEDVMTIGRRFTLSVGLRFDEVRGISQDVDDLALTGIMALSFDAQGTVAVRGQLYHRKNLSPRTGFNLRFNGSGRTVLRGNWGRFFRTAITGKLSGIRPGQSTVREFLWNATTGAYDTPDSIYTPDTSFGFDPEARAARTDPFSIGLD